jgi:excisionase family DNA binding protein
MERLLTVAEVAKILTVSEKTIRRMIDRGDLEAVWIGRSVRISPKELAALMGGRRS